MANTTITIGVGGMSCQHCVRAVKGGVSAVAGVQDVDVSLEKNQVTVTFDAARATPAAIKTRDRGPGLHGEVEWGRRSGASSSSTTSRRSPEVVGSYLSAAGYVPIAACDGAAALSLFEDTHPCLVILDLMLPDIGGEEVCRRIRARSRVPVIMLTAKVEDADALRGFSLGADDYVTKPFSPRQLMARVEAVLRRAAGPGAPPRPISFILP